MATEQVYIKYYPDTSAFEAALRRYEARVARLNSAVAGGGVADRNASIATQPGQTRLSTATSPRGTVPSPVITTFGFPASAPSITIHAVDATAIAAAAAAVHASLATKLANGNGTVVKTLTGGRLPALPPAPQHPALPPVTPRSLTFDQAAEIAVRQAGFGDVQRTRRIVTFDEMRERIIDADFTVIPPGAPGRGTSGANRARAKTRATARKKARLLSAARKGLEIGRSVGLGTPTLLSAAGLLTTALMLGKDSIDRMERAAIERRDLSFGEATRQSFIGLFRQGVDEMFVPGAIWLGRGIAGLLDDIGLLGPTPFPVNRQRMLNHVAANAVRYLTGKPSIEVEKGNIKNAVQATMIEESRALSNRMQTAGFSGTGVSFFSTLFEQMTNSPAYSQKLTQAVMKQSEGSKDG